MIFQARQVKRNLVQDESTVFQMHSSVLVNRFSESHSPVRTRAGFEGSSWTETDTKERLPTERRKRADGESEKKEAQATARVPADPKPAQP